MNGFENQPTKVLVKIHGNLARALEAFVALSPEAQLQGGSAGVSPADVASIRLPLLRSIESVLRSRGLEV